MSTFDDPEHNLSDFIYSGFMGFFSIIGGGFLVIAVSNVEILCLILSGDISEDILKSSNLDLGPYLLFLGIWTLIESGIDAISKSFWKCFGYLIGAVVGTCILVWYISSTFSEVIGATIGTIVVLTLGIIIKIWGLLRKLNNNQYDYTGWE